MENKMLASTRSLLKLLHDNTVFNREVEDWASQELRQLIVKETMAQDKFDEFITKNDRYQALYHNKLNAATAREQREDAERDTLEAMRGDLKARIILHGVTPEIETEVHEYLTKLGVIK